MTDIPYKSSIAKWLHERLTNFFKKIPSIDFQECEMMLSTIIKDESTCNSDDPIENLGKVRVALNEMVDAGVLLDYQEEPNYDKKISDIKFTFYPGPNF